MGVKTILSELRNRGDSPVKFVVQENEDGTISYGLTDTYGTAAIGSVVNPAHATEHAAMGLASNWITVGTGGKYLTLEEAAIAAAALNPSASNWVTIEIQSGTTLTLTAPIELPEYCVLVGRNRKTSIVVGSGNNNIRYRKWNVFESFTLNYSGTGSKSAGFRASDSIGTGSQDGSIVDYRCLDINVTANQRSAIYAQVAEMTTIENCQIITSGIGIEIWSGYHIHVKNSEIYLSNTNTGYPHYGIFHRSTRLTIWNSKISCGYGPLAASTSGIENETDQDIVGIYSSAPSGSTRLDIFGLWSIIRNEDGAAAGKKCCCIWNDSSYNVARIWSAYFQVENGVNSSVGDNYEILNTGTPTAELGLVQISPAVRARRVGGAVYNTGPAIGMPATVTADATLAIGRGGLYRVDTTAGNVTITLPNPGTYFTPNITYAERYTFKRMTTGNTITIAAAGSGTTIDGAATLVMSATQYAISEVVWCVDSNMWLVV